MAVKAFDDDLHVSFLIDGDTIDSEVMANLLFEGEISAADTLQATANFLRDLMSDVDGVEGWTAVAETSLVNALSLLEMAAADENRWAKEARNVAD